MLVTVVGKMFIKINRCSYYWSLFVNAARRLYMLLETGRLLLVFIDNCELLHLVRRQVSSQAGFNLFKNLVSRELFRILENFHFSISISKHFDFTFHFSKKSESILISLCTSRKRVKAFYFHFSLLELQKPTLAGPWQISHRTPPFWTLNDALLAAAFGKLCMVSRFIHWIISLTRVYRLCQNFTELDVCFNFV